jgi:hypothetical protein
VITDLFVDDLLSLDAALQDVIPDVNSLADPRTKWTLPFPFLSKMLPSEPFHPSQHHAGCDFQYMDREGFLKVWNAVQETRKPIGHRRIYIHGMIGYGKSHILAALACSLAHEGCHLVFLPECREMLQSPVTYLKTALLCGFADLTSYAHRVAIRSCRSIRDEAQWALFAELLEMMTPHRSITSASVNHRTIAHMERTQTNDIELSMLGGMSEVSNVLAATLYVLHRRAHHTE